MSVRRPALVRELTEKLRTSATMDWQKHEGARARMHTLEVLLKRYRYPPDAEEKAMERVIAQAENRADRWGGECVAGRPGHGRRSAWTCKLNANALLLPFAFCMLDEFAGRYLDALSLVEGAVVDADFCLSGSGFFQQDDLGTGDATQRDLFKS